MNCALCIDFMMGYTSGDNIDQRFLDDFSRTAVAKALQIHTADRAKDTAVGTAAVFVLVNFLAHLGFHADVYMGHSIVAVKKVVIELANTLNITLWQATDGLREVVPEGFQVRPLDTSRQHSEGGIQWKYCPQGRLTGFAQLGKTQVHLFQL